MSLLSSNIGGHCPGGICDYIVVFSEVLVVVLLLDCFVVLVTLIPPLFSWKNVKPDSKKRILFAAFACVTFYFWLAVLGVHTLYCFGFLAHQGPCANKTYSLSSTAAPQTPITTPVAVADSSPPVPDSGVDSSAPDSAIAGDYLDSIIGSPPPSLILSSEEAEHISRVEDLAANLSGVAATAEAYVAECSKEADSAITNLTLVNVLIVIVLLVTLAANINEALNGRALYHCETLCRKEDLQRFLNTLVSKRPEVGHLVKCFHTSKSADAKTNTGHKVVTYSTVDNFNYQTWKDFSDLRLIEPSLEYPVIEVEVLLNFFPGDHVTADKYKSFVQKLTKENSGKDQRISIDDYFHIEDQREWTFFIGNQKYIVPWWQRNPAKIILSCIFLIGWPFRLSYKGRVAKHRLEVKKAVFCENTSQDEGVSLSATPGESSSSSSSKVAVEVQNPEDKELVVDVQVSSPPPYNGYRSSGTSDRSPDRSTPLLNRHSGSNHPLAGANTSGSNPPATSGPNHPLAGPPANSGSTPPTAAAAGPKHPLGGPANGGSLANHSLGNHLPGNHPVRSAPLASPRTHMRETTKDIVTAVTHQDINGMNAVSTVALKDIDVQMSALSGYETYV